MPNLGWISPADRTQAQMDAHEAAIKRMPKFAIVGGKTTLDKGEKVVLLDFLDRPEVVADIGFKFSYFHQFTGSCIGVSLGDDLTCLSAVQRMNPDNPTKAFVPFWPYDYGRTRADEGDRGQGEGAVNSVATERMKKGVLPISEATGLPQFKMTDDGLQLSESIEMQWSDGNTSMIKQYDATASKFPLGTAAVSNGPEDTIAGIINGYPGYGGSDYYVDGGTLKGSGANACVIGKYNGRGGHSTCFPGAWNHPDFGMLLLYWNQWFASTYPFDPSLGYTRCTCWVPIEETRKVWTQYSGRGENFNLSHQTYYPAQPFVADWLI